MIYQQIGQPEEMNKFLEIENLPKLKQEEIENLNRIITSKGIESVIKKIPTKKSPGPEDFTGKFCQTFKEELIPIFLKLSPKNRSQKNASKIILLGKHYPDTKTR